MLSVGDPHLSNKRPIMGDISPGHSTNNYLRLCTVDGPPQVLSPAAAKRNTKLPHSALVSPRSSVWLFQFLYLIGWALAPSRASNWSDETCLFSDCWHHVSWAKGVLLTSL